MQKVQEYIDETDCPIKNPSQLLQETAMSCIGRVKNYPYLKVIQDFNIWYDDNIIRVEDGTMRDAEMYQKIQKYIDETDCIIKDSKQLLREYFNNCCFWRPTRYKDVAKEFEMWYKKNIEPYR